MKDEVDEVSESTYIYLKDKYSKFIGELSKSKIETRIFLKLVNIKGDEEEEDF